MQRWMLKLSNCETPKQGPGPACFLSLGQGQKKGLQFFNKTTNLDTTHPDSVGKWIRVEVESIFHIFVPFKLCWNRTEGKEPWCDSLFIIMTIIMNNESHNRVLSLLCYLATSRFALAASLLAASLSCFAFTFALAMLISWRWKPNNGQFLHSKEQEEITQPKHISSDLRYTFLTSIDSHLPDPKNTCSLPKVWTLMNTIVNWTVLFQVEVLSLRFHLPFPCCPSSSQIQTVAVFVVPHVPVALAHAWRLTLQLNHSQNHTFHQMVSGTRDLVSSILKVQTM